MSDFLAAFLLLIALASVGSFAASDAGSLQCSANFLNICW